MGSSERKEEGCFVPVAGLKLVYDPAKRSLAAPGKHPCPDCHFCQQCGDDRCHICRGKGGATLIRRASASNPSSRNRLHEKVDAQACTVEPLNRADSEQP